MSIIGNGDIATALCEHDKLDFIYFASGVSDSQCTDETQFSRELALLSLQSKRKKIIYFSTLSMFYYSDNYQAHKKEMERQIKRFPRYCIIRLGNITFGKNPNTLINNLKLKIKSGERYTIKDEFRYLCSQQEFDHWINLIPNFNCEMNITGERVKVKEIVERIKNGTL